MHDRRCEDVIYTVKTDHSALSYVPAAVVHIIPEKALLSWK